MAKPTNLTERLTHLRERKGGPPKAKHPPKAPTAGVPRERPLATDYFMLFAYSLAVIALLAQPAWILWLELR